MNKHARLRPERAPKGVNWPKTVLSTPRSFSASNKGQAWNLLNSHPPFARFSYAVLVHIFLSFLSYTFIYFKVSTSLTLLSRGMSRKVLMPFLRISRTISSLCSVTCFARNKKSHLYYAVDVSFLKTSLSSVTSPTYTVGRKCKIILEKLEEIRKWENRRYFPPLYLAAQFYYTNVGYHFVTLSSLNI